jgi:hypothetical protein
MGSRKQIYRIISTGELVIPVGFDIRRTPSDFQEDLVFEFLDEDGNPTGETTELTLDEVEES